MQVNKYPKIISCFHKSIILEFSVKKDRVTERIHGQSSSCSKCFQTVIQLGPNLSLYKKMDFGICFFFFLLRPKRWESFLSLHCCQQSCHINVFLFLYLSFYFVTQIPTYFSYSFHFTFLLDILFIISLLFFLFPFFS